MFIVQNKPGDIFSFIPFWGKSVGSKNIIYMSVVRHGIVQRSGRHPLVNGDLGK